MVTSVYYHTIKRYYNPEDGDLKQLYCWQSQLRIYECISLLEIAFKQELYVLM
jgi:hypothetical protein